MSYMGHLGSIPDLNTLTDISIIAPIQNQILAYNSSTGRWENKNIVSMSISIDDLSDVEITSPQSGQVVMFDGNVWKNDFATRADRGYQFFLSSFN